MKLSILSASVCLYDCTCFYNPILSSLIVLANVWVCVSMLSFSCLSYDLDNAFESYSLSCISFVAIKGFSEYTLQLISVPEMRDPRTGKLNFLRNILRGLVLIYLKTKVRPRIYYFNIFNKKRKILNTWLFLFFPPYAYDEFTRALCNNQRWELVIDSQKQEYSFRHKDDN